MIDGLSVVAIVTARGGSRGLPGKNILEIGGRPLLAWSVLAARNSEYVDRICVTSDDDAILGVARSFSDVDIITRPTELASDTAKVEDAILHAVTSLEDRFDLLVLLQPTSPLRTGEDIDGAIATCVAGDAPAAISVTAPGKSPYWMCTKNEDGTLERLIPIDSDIHRRQDLPEVFAFNGAVYVARTDWFSETKTFFGPGTVGYVMPPERSADIDAEIDLKYVEFLIETQKESTMEPERRI